MTALQVFTKALEKTFNVPYISSVSYVNLRIPMYKEFTFTLRDMSEHGKTYKMTHKAPVRNYEERTELIEAVTEDFIAYVLTELLKDKEHETI